MTHNPLTRRASSLFTLSALSLLLPSIASAASFSWNTPNSTGTAFPGMTVNEIESIVGGANTSPAQAHGIHANLGGDVLAFSSAMGLGVGASGQITAIGNSAFSLAVGDDITLRTAWTPGSASSGFATGLDNIIFELGIISATSGRLFDGTTDQFFLGGVERAPGGGAANVIGSFMNESVVVSELNGGVPQAFPTKPSGTFNEQVYAISLRLQRLANNDIALGLDIDHYQSDLSMTTLIQAGFLSGSGVIAEADHGFTSWDEFYPALGYQVEDRAALSITGTSYDWALDLPETVPDLVPEPSSSLLSLLAGAGLLFNRRRRK